MSDGISEGIETVVAIGTGALALVTWRLAAQTKNLAAEGRLAADATERQHRQQLTPLCKFAQSSFGVNGVSRAGRQVTDVLSPGAFRNSGAGPAFEVTVVARLASEKYGTIWAKVGPMGPGEEIPPFAPLETDFDYAKASREARIEIEYVDLFKQRYQTVYMLEPRMVYVRGPESPLTGKGSDMLFPPE